MSNMTTTLSRKGFPRTCTHPGCERPYDSKGYCSAHVQRMRHGRDMDAPLRTYNPGRGCYVEDCWRKHSGQGLCKLHLDRHRRGDPLDAPIRVVDPTRGCSVEGCEEPHKANGMCQSHNGRMQKYGNLDPRRADPTNPDTWNRSMSQGYWRLATNVGGTYRSIQEHRWVMEKHLGRPLLPTEEVHHKNTIKTDNRLENLELWAHSQPSGARVSDLLEWAEQIIAQYGPEREKI